MKETVIDIDQLTQDDKNFNKGTEEGSELMEKSFKELGAGRSIVVDKDNRIIAGNKSQLAAKAAGIKKIRVIETTGDELIAVKRTDLSLDSDKGRKLALADNRTAQINLAWDDTQLNDCADQIADFDTTMLLGYTNALDADIGQETIKAKRKAWHKGKDYYEPLCDLKDTPSLHLKEGSLYMASYQSGKEGKPLSKIKTEDNVLLFALQAQRMVQGIVGLDNPEGWCIVTTPKRRHKAQNFAEMVCTKLSEILHIPFYPEVLQAKNRARVNPVFTLVRDIQEPNIILYDDIITTGSTIQASADQLKGHNILRVIGINNR